MHRTSVSCKNGRTDLRVNRCCVRQSCGPREPCIRWDAHRRHLANTVERSVRGGDAALCQMTLTTCCVCGRRRSRVALSSRCRCVLTPSLCRSSCSLHGSPINYCTLLARPAAAKKQSKAGLWSAAVFNFYVFGGRHFSALTLLVGRPVKNWVVGCWRGYLSGARCRLAYGPADATATHCLLQLLQ